MAPVTTQERTPPAAEVPGAAGAPDAAEVPDAEGALFADERLTVAGLFAESYAGLLARSTGQLGAHGLSVVEFEVLIRLARTPLGLLRMTDLSAQTSVTTSGITRVVDRLQERGLVSRQACETDRRATYAVITEAGRHLMAAVLPGHLELIETWLTGPLRESGDLEAFAAIMRRVRDRVVPGAEAGSAGPLPGSRVGGSAPGRRTGG